MIQYLILVVFVILLPLFAVDVVGQGQPWFCKYICPAGTLGAGIPLTTLDAALRAGLGWLYTHKLIILAVTLVASVFIFRPFCKYICPLGGLYSLFNPIAFYKIRLDKSKCIDCGACERTCRMQVQVRKQPNSPECIRCGKCTTICPTDALKFRFVHRRTEKK